ncbi:hypothetical protein FH972_008605 [Carpinus fangiana]|uniref:Uncharacterized protein n=1 Tax=Carpinus fangiana TaxID=176857 RepID=A0A5N6QZB0_9ROSI|nr:hypothetical protein FH972_008605 [Carpinus fangiana]
MDLGVSRRKMMIYLTAGALSGGRTDSIEARVVKPEIRRKIRKKLKMLRKKAGLSKPKNDNGMKTSSEQPSVKEKKLSSLPSPIPSPNSKELLLEATLSDSNDTPSYDP